MLIADKRYIMSFGKPPRCFFIDIKRTCLCEKRRAAVRDTPFDMPTPRVCEKNQYNFTYPEGTTMFSWQSTLLK